MERNALHLPAHYAIIETDELTYLDGGELSELQAKVLLGSISAILTSIVLIPNVFSYALSPILDPISNKIEDITKSIVNSIKNLF